MQSREKVNSRLSRSVVVASHADDEFLLQAAVLGGVGSDSATHWAGAAVLFSKLSGTLLRLAAITGTYKPTGAICGLGVCLPTKYTGSSCALNAGGAVTVGPGSHIAFRASEPSAVDRFHRAALQAGGRDNGAPGPRPHYSATYYAAFVIDPDGNNVEAVRP